MSKKDLSSGVHPGNKIPRNTNFENDVPGCEGMFCYRSDLKILLEIIRFKYLKHPQYNIIYIFFFNKLHNIY